MDCIGLNWTKIYLLKVYFEGILDNFKSKIETLEKAAESTEKSPAGALGR